MSKTVLTLGAGMVVRPMIEYLGKHGFQQIVTDIIEAKAQHVIRGIQGARAVELDSADPTRMEQLIDQADLVVSMLPATMHPLVARLCLKHKKNMVTASYVSPAMREMDAEVKAAGLLFLNEIGVDPGIDHMSAMKIIHRIAGKGGKVTGFYSYCGGLPALDANTNPMGYKFSWAPKGVLRAARNSAKYLKDGHFVEIPGPELFHHYWFQTVGGIVFEAYANRDSLSYIETYGLNGIETMYRGTLRNVGHCDTWWALSNLGFFSENETYENLTGTVADFIRDRMLNLPADACLKKAIGEQLGLHPDSVILKKFDWLGFFDNTPIPVEKGAPIDVLTELMLQKMSYDPGERDLLAMQHVIIAQYADHAEKIVSSMIDLGIPNGDSSMSRTVSLPVAIAVRMILEGRVTLNGVQIPVMPELYNPVLAELETMGIRFTETEETITK